VNGMNALGRHFLIEVWEATNLDRPDIIEEALIEAVRATGGTLLDTKIVPFPNGAASGVAIIAESHLSIHTWPELGYAAVDMFTCNKDMDIDGGIEVLNKYFSPGNIQILEIRRGLTA
jgi:S-adenosylmethionine decarboxylase